MIYPFKDKKYGFTLIEVIIAIIVMAILGTVAVSYLGTSLTNSSLPITNIKQSCALQTVMENITADYKANFMSNLSGLSAAIGSGNQSNGYGQYTVVDNKFIQFNSSGQEIAGLSTDARPLLKVSIKNSLGEILTVLFSSV